MAMKFLPIHRSMYNSLEKGMNVVHNGRGNRQGMKGVIRMVRPTKTVGFVTIKYSTGAIQDYSREWFLDNFYIFVGDIKGMGGCFNGVPFIDKYSEYAVTLPMLKEKQRPKHEAIKLIVNAKEAGATPVLDDPNDPLDEVGTFMVISGEGKWHGTHKTQRLAEIAAAAEVKKNNTRMRIVKHVADVEPRVVIEADVVRK